VAHFDTLSPLPENTRDFIYKMNAVLPGDIAIVNVCAVMPDDHARYSAISRTYQYTICRVKDPFTPELSWYYSLPLDMEAMNQAALLLKGYTDFTSFSKLHSDVKNNHCGILDATWSEEGTFMIFTIRANRFLRNMVRSIVGTMTDIGRGKLDMPGFKAVIEGKNRNLAGFSVPPQGLSLFEITYPAHIKL
jgi:tRNA pseudouridine38-40 synthase